MSARKRHTGATMVFLAVACGAHDTVPAAEEELPDLAFLEYLGSWEESDEDWLLLKELSEKPAAAQDSRHEDAEPTVEESTEAEHGS